MRAVLTPEQKQFIRDNRLVLSMNQMVQILNVPISRVRNFMIKNKLQLDKDELYNLRSEQMKRSHKKRPRKEDSYTPPPHVPDPWNHGLNLHTMRPTSKTTPPPNPVAVYDYVMID